MTTIKNAPVRLARLHPFRCSSAYAVLGFIIAIVHFSSAPLFAGQCNDGKDNDGDKRVDALVNVTTNKATLTVNKGENPFSFLAIINAKAPGFGDGKLGNLSGHAVSRDFYSARRICNYYGYRTVKSTDCSSPHYQNRCNFDSAGDNWLYKWDGTKRRWVSTKAKGKQWLTKIVCLNRAPACDDGIDNDGDGKTDLKDSGCYS
ncbi:MAG: hypothetical protein KDD62_03600, partial [Bdellovibrionales bacterium]|nr:hypothetical protein [Bdellovibrionales bacterium]